MLTPANIDGKRFSTTRIKEGYVQEDVDNFLDAVADAWKSDQLTLMHQAEEIKTLRRKLAYIEAGPPAEAPTVAAPAVPEAPSAVAERLLTVAQQAAEQHEAEARQKADEVIREAGGRGARLIEEAQAAAEKIKNDGYAEKYKKFEELEAKHQKVQAFVTGLQTDAARIREALNKAIVTYDREMGS